MRYIGINYIQFMENYDKIIAQFQSMGYTQTSLLDEYEITKALDNIYQKSTKSEDIFNRDIAQQIFEQARKNENQQVRVKDYVQTIIQAQILLKRYINEHRQKLKSCQDQLEMAELATHLQQYEEDYQLLTLPFCLQNKLSHQSVIPESRISNASNFSEFFSESPPIANQSQSLKIVLVISLVSFVVQFLLMFEKQHFLSMLTHISVLSIFILSYFDRTHIRVTLYLLIISTFFDLLWVILQADHYWNAEGASHHSNNQTGFRRFVYIMTLLSMFAKGAITYLLFKYRTNTPQSSKIVRLFGLRFELTAAAASPLSLLIEKSM